MRRLLKAATLLVAGVLGLLLVGRLELGLALPLGRAAGVAGDRAVFQNDHCTTTVTKVTKGSSVDTWCTGTMHVRSAGWSLALHDPLPQPAPGGTLDFRCTGHACTQPEAFPVALGLLSECLLLAITTASLRALLTAARTWLQRDAPLITAPRWTRRAASAWLRYCQALVLAFCASVVATGVTFFL
ncbi:hypothetical protein [Kitasatospora viridis]|uniref:Uncharacterized protein n=1 Tax=Kitasatospora viridis TaxID=281105 RepID=A0A561UBB7_9ACTN|nr:hypothetical protein [Kitasatospora viridis]TWF96644.1 hypothetical protein FHX73_11416 [Kitasatospora viridis]